MMRALKRTIIVGCFLLLIAGAIVLRLIWQPSVEWHGNILDAARAQEQRARIEGPLRASAGNSPYFADKNGKAVYLTGSHVWNNLQDIEPPLQMDDGGKWLEPAGASIAFDFANYLTFLVKENHNFIRLWAWEEPTWLSWLNSRVTIDPSPYSRTGPGVGLDGLPKFNLSEFNQAYFDRLRERVREAGDRGIYVSVMLFQGWSIESKGMTGKNPWRAHPFHRANNVNGVNGDRNGDAEGTETHTLQVAEITAVQEAYVRKVVTTLNDLDNVLYEITNESPGGSVDWQCHMINFVKHCETEQPKQHPVGMTTCNPACENAELFASPADWISPNKTDNEDYCGNPPAGRGGKVIISDTDHLCGVFCDYEWVWKSFIRGLNPILMDPIWMPKFEVTRKAMGMTLAYARRMDLSQMRPRGDLASSGYCLANPGSEYLVYLPFEPNNFDSMRFVRKIRNKINNLRSRFRRTVTVDLSHASGVFRVEWCNPISGGIVDGAAIQAGATSAFTAPFGGDAVLYIRKG